VVLLEESLNLMKADSSQSTREAPRCELCLGDQEGMDELVQVAANLTDFMG
jgi:hypothetical protein